MLALRFAIVRHTLKDDRILRPLFVNTIGTSGNANDLVRKKWKRFVPVFYS